MKNICPICELMKCKIIENDVELYDILLHICLNKPLLLLNKHILYEEKILNFLIKKCQNKNNEFNDDIMNDRDDMNETGNINDNNNDLYKINMNKKKKLIRWKKEKFIEKQIENYILNNKIIWNDSSLWSKISSNKTNKLEKNTSTTNNSNWLIEYTKWGFSKVTDLIFYSDENDDYDAILEHQQNEEDIMNHNTKNDELEEIFINKWNNNENIFLIDLFKLICNKIIQNISSEMNNLLLYIIHPGTAIFHKSSKRQEYIIEDNLPLSLQEFFYMIALKEMKMENFKFFHYLSNNNLINLNIIINYLKYLYSISESNLLIINDDKYIKFIIDLNHNSNQNDENIKINESNLSILNIRKSIYDFKNKIKSVEIKRDLCKKNALLKKKNNQTKEALFHLKRYKAFIKYIDTISNSIFQLQTSLHTIYTMHTNHLIYNALNEATGIMKKTRESIGITVDDIDNAFDDLQDEKENIDELNNLMETNLYNQNQYDFDEDELLQELSELNLDDNIEEVNNNNNNNVLIEDNKKFDIYNGMIDSDNEEEEKTLVAG